MKAKGLLIVSVICLLMGLTACAGGPEMPMELTVDGHTIVLGKTTMKEMTDLGYEVYVTGTPDTIKKDAKYVPFYYSLTKGVGNEMFVTVCVPWGGSADVSAEQASAPSEGIIKRVEVRTSTVEKVAASYNGEEIKELTFEKAIEWGAKQKEDASVKTYEIKAKDGFLKFESENTSGEDFHTFSVELKMDVFEKMQK